MLSLAFAACLTAVEAQNLRCRDVRRVSEGLLIQIQGRRQGVAIPLAHGRHCPVTYWDDWEAELRQLGMAEGSSPAFPGLRGGRPTEAAMNVFALSRVVTRAVRAAGIEGGYGFASLRLGFIRTALRAGVPDVLILEQAGLTTMSALQRHAVRERLISHSVAGVVGM